MKLIDIDEVEKITWQEPNYTDALNVLAEVREKVRELPTIESIPKVNIYKAIQEMMKYEHEGFINISLARLDEILKKCGVSENGNDD